MNHIRKSILLATLLAAQACSSGQQSSQETINEPMQHEHLLNEEPSDHKIIVYQIFTRLFGNKVNQNKPWAPSDINGVGKFNDIDDTALKQLKDLGVSHVWYTGVIEHALVVDYTQYGIPLDDADVVKGRAGSPYAIKDYYDVNPDLAVNVPQRMAEFEALVKRTHQNDLKVIIDFVPNHVARRYISDARPAGVKDLGEDDNTSVTFDANNNFYYIPGESFKVPAGYVPLGNYDFKTKDGQFQEVPAKVTGNGAAKAQPDINDWFETVKINYGVDIQNNNRTHFEPVPNTWNKMRDILVFWAGKDVDGFRCDMAEMVPVEFWQWVIPQVKAVKPTVVFIAEIYNPNEYRNYIDKGRFDYLYDKVGLYDTVRAIMHGGGDTKHLTGQWKSVEGINNHMLRFLENHDEQRIASPEFAGDARAGIPGMTVSATLSTGPVMIYFGQEVGEKGAGEAGFSGNDGRTTIFDYWGVPAHQQWMNGGKFDGGGLSDQQRALREFYKRLLTTTRNSEAIRKGYLFDLHPHNRYPRTHGYHDAKVYSYLRYTDKERVLVVVNFDRENSHDAVIKIPSAAWQAMGLQKNKSLKGKDLLGYHANIESSAADLLDEGDPYKGFRLDLKPMSAHIFELK